MRNVDLRRIRHVFLDMDGTIYHGSEIYPTTRPFLDFLRGRGIKFTFLTNNSSESIPEYVAKLQKMGVECDADNFYTSVSFTCDFIRRNHPDVLTLFVLGSPAVCDEFRQAGFTVNENSNAVPPDGAIVTFDRTLTYDKLCRAAFLLKNNVPTFATHPDLYCATNLPTFLPDCGSLVKCLESATDCRITTLGKPLPDMLRFAAARHGLAPELCLMCGDRLSTDIILGINAGAATCRITGAGADLTPNSEIKPDFTCDNLGELQKLWSSSITPAVPKKSDAPEKIYDVAVIGGGVSGAAVAWQLSRYQLSCCLLEQCADVCFGVSKANSGIVHGGFHHTADTLKAKLELRGSLMFEKLSRELDFPFKRTGIVVVAFSDEQMAVVHKLYQRGIANGVRNLELCGAEQLRRLEPSLRDNVVGGFFAPDGGTVEPYRYVFGLVEAAQRNGLELFCNFAVSSGHYDGRCWLLRAADGREIKTRFVVNAAGLFADEVSRMCGAEQFTIQVRKGEEYLLDRNSTIRPQRVIFPVPTPDSKGVLVIPTAEGTTMIGPTAEDGDDKNDTATSAENMDRIFNLVGSMVNGIRRADAITAFAGLRPVLPGNDFYIAPSQCVPAFIQVAGIQSPGLTASPAIGEYVKDLLKECGLPMAEKAHIIDALSPHREARRESEEQLAELHDAIPGITDIVCRCEKISEAEIIEAVRRGHHTVDGVKFYTRGGMGRCQGGFCTARILQIISRESGIPMSELTKKGGNSRILGGKLGELEVGKND